MELYIHIPFCKQKCRYCSFISASVPDTAYEPYIRLLLAEASQRQAEATEPVETVYIGGGTPSLLHPDLLTSLVVKLRTIFDLSRIREFTIEANPGTVTPEWLTAAAGCGVNRISFGMQAYQEHLLRILGRIHCFDEVRRSVEMAAAAGISNINLDLMFGIPVQTPADWKESLMKALELGPSHISAYGLIPEEGTPLFDDLESGRLSLPDADAERGMYDDAIRILSRNGYEQYEISNFARPGFECIHNIGYWTQIPYLGLGVSSASMAVVRSGVGGMVCERRKNPDGMDVYHEMVCTGKKWYETETVQPSESRFETLMLGLRMNRGIDEKAFLAMHGVGLNDCFGDRLRSLQEGNLMMHGNGRWKLTRKGMDIQNSILVELMDD